MPPRTLLLTLDAFHTLFYPRLPVPVQYAQVAQSLHFPPHLSGRNKLTTADLAAKISIAFRAAYKDESSRRPNFGRKVMGFGGPREWWANVIRGCFMRVVTHDAGDGGDIEGVVEIPEELVQRLLKRFESREAYLLYPDVEEFLARMRRWRQKKEEKKKEKRRLLDYEGEANGGVQQQGFERVIVGVISNSDDRIANILTSLGVRVGPLGWTTTTAAAAAAAVPSVVEIGLGGSSPPDIDFIVTSYEAGEEKPHRSIFEFAKERAKECLGRDASLTWMKDTNWSHIHIGDHYENDYEGAINAGWDSFLLPRDGDGPGLSEYRHDSSQSSVKQIQALTDIFPELGIDA
ncbi:hypothetical protein ACJ72_04952 [Emergomyces africanus]|uniref:Haloacid dehalogenase-like hydrolase domain-containing protein 3 n=1 Tax=Emergomyces africanus TaxID=1955775 RepID=A0A1B7NVE2_9EURO|nr:hypothetical protein ACJ72_04952 [Emergomyces africanus]